MRTWCTSQGTLLNALWWPNWEGNPKKEAIYVYTYQGLPTGSDGKESACIYIYIHTHTHDSLCYAAEINTTL